MPKLAYGVSLAIALTLPTTATASWYARLENGTKVTECVQFDEPLDKTWATLNRRFGVKCEVVNDPRWRVVGTAFRCGVAGLQLFFRTRENCEAFQATANAGQHANASDYVPRGVTNRDGWIVAYDGCMEKGATPENVAKLGLQRIADYCLCVSNRLGAYKDKEVTASVATRAAENCSGSTLDGVTRNFLLGGFERTIKGADKRRQVSNSQSSETPGVVQEQAAPKSDVVIRKGDRYSEIMERLKGIPAEKYPYGDYLDVTYKAPSLLAYPDAGGNCKLTFAKGRLMTCTGCEPGRFKCEAGQ